MGLAMCEKIITKHEGKIWYETELGKGTSFYFTIKK
jgi:signal transduction histidine kinase